MSDEQLVIYPSNWLYNAGVIGLLRSAVDVETLAVEGFLDAHGTVSFSLPFFSQLRSHDRYFSRNKISSIVGNNILYRNFLQSNQKELFIEFVKALDSLANGQCDICGNGKYLKQCVLDRLNAIDPAKKEETKFLHRIRSFSIVHYSELGPSLNEFPNAFWSFQQSARICHLCTFLIIHHHLALTRLSDGSKIFINAPSFQVMWYLNKFAREVFGSASSEEMRSKRNILAMSVIEYATKIQTTLGAWTGMNIEVVSKRGGKVEFFSLPYEVIQLLADRRIASLLSQIGEFSVLNLVLAQDFSRLLELGYRLLRIGLKPHEEWGKSERDFVNQTLRLDKNRENPARVADQIFQLYAITEEKRKRREPYEQYRIF